jgi:hypothetical protein
MSSNAVGFHEVVPETLDSLWARAEHLGTVEVDHGWTDALYVVTITFVRKTGTRILARGKDTSIHAAVSKAIQEAVYLGS